MIVEAHRSAFARAVLALHMHDGTVLLCDGEPTHDSGVVVKPYRPQSEILSFRQFKEDVARPPQTEFIANVRWENPKTSISHAARGWRGRFKKWLKEFPTS